MHHRFEFFQKVFSNSALKLFEQLSAITMTATRPDEKAGFSFFWMVSDSTFSGRRDYDHYLYNERNEAQINFQKALFLNKRKRFETQNQRMLENDAQVDGAASCIPFKIGDTVILFSEVTLETKKSL